MYSCLKLISMWVHPWQPRLCIRLPRVQHIQIVLTAAHLAQVLNAVVTLVAIDVVYLLRRPFSGIPHQVHVHRHLSHFSHLTHRETQS